MSKKSERVAFTFDERSTTTLKNMTEEGHFSSFSSRPVSGHTEITVRHPVTGEVAIIRIPALPPLGRQN